MSWLNINSSHLDSSCGHEYDLSVAAALDGSNIWQHNVNEIHWFILDLGQTFTLTKVKGRSNTPADPINVNIYVSDDKENWGEAVVAGIDTWQDCGGLQWREIDIFEKSGRYVKVEIIETELVFGLIMWTTGSPEFGSIFDIYGELLKKKTAPVLNLGGSGSGINSWDF